MQKRIRIEKLVLFWFILELCPELTAPENGQMYAPRSVNSVATFTCNDGYQRIGPNMAVCQSDFTWSNDPPICEEGYVMFIFFLYLLT